MDPLFKVEVVSQTPNPQQTMYAAMHQCYSDRPAVETRDRWPGETACGQIAVKRLLDGGRGHFGILESPQITLNCCYFPHSVLQQARTHRVGISFAAQSFRYTGEGMTKALLPGGFEENIEVIERLFYLRPVGDYRDRQGKKYFYSEDLRRADLMCCFDAILRYIKAIEAGISEEHARGCLPFDYRQHFVVSFNARSFLHFMDLRSKKDAQIEIQWLCDLLWPKYEDWVPEIAAWYKENRLGKARLSP